MDNLVVGKTRTISRKDGPKNMLLCLVRGEHVVHTRRRTSTECTCEDDDGEAEVHVEGKGRGANPESGLFIPKGKQGHEV